MGEDWFWVFAFIKIVCRTLRPQPEAPAHYCKTEAFHLSEDSFCLGKFADGPAPY